jgi:hemerythrin-like domain-containing protein
MEVEMDAALLEQLESEHREVEQLFAKLEKAKGEPEQLQLVTQLENALSKHMEVEETQVYPELASLDREMEQEAETEHDLGREGIAKLKELIGKPGFGAAVAMTQAGIEHHVEEEETQVFPKLRKELGLGGKNRSRSKSSSSGSDGSETTKEELYEKAKKKGIEGRSSMSKDELEKALENA